MKLTYIYVKESPYGLFYLGKTELDPYIYLGSGKIWIRHIKKHKLTVNQIKTHILHKTTDKNDLETMGIYYSDLFNIVESKNWANLRKETGDGGDTSKFINWKDLKFIKGDDHWTRNLTKEQHKRLSEKMIGENNPAKRQEVKEKIREKAIGRKPSTETIEKFKQRIGEKNGFYGKNHSNDTLKTMKEKAKGRWTLQWFIDKYGDTEGVIKYNQNCERLKKPISKKMVRNEYKCPHCELIGKGPNMIRYHFDNCKKNNKTISYENIKTKAKIQIRKA